MSHSFDRSLKARLKLASLRRAYLLRAEWSVRRLQKLQESQSALKNQDVQVFATFRNEAHRLERFLDHYRDLGVTAFHLVDNDSTDDPQAVLKDQQDVTLWHTKDSYKKARFGQDWMNGLMARYGRGRWCICVDLDEFLIYPHHDTRPIASLTAWLESRHLYSMAAPMIDVFKNPSNTDASALYFDPSGFRYEMNPLYRNTWMQGGMRARVFFAGSPEKAPALNKIPLVKWQSGTVYVSSMHNLLPRRLNTTYHTEGARLTGALLHTKFADAYLDKIKEEQSRNEHYKGGREYARYADDESGAFYHSGAQVYENWEQLETLGLISRGAWA